MKFAWILGLILLTQPIAFQNASTLNYGHSQKPDHFSLDHEQQMQKSINHKQNHYSNQSTKDTHPKVSEHLTITHEQEPLMTINRSDLTEPLLSFPFVDSIRVQLITDQLYHHTYRKPIDAFINEHGQMISEQPGQELNKSAFTNQIYSYYYNNGPAFINLPMRPLHPRVDIELLSDIKSKMIGYYVTYFNNRNKERSNNISLASEAINNQVVFPGEVFSFNQTVGERTKVKGYLPAKIIVKGEYSEGIGGGICQVSSTLFNAVDRAGLHIIKRYSHSRSVAYVPPGRDATVSWYGPDFSFKNDYNHPILIRSKVQGGMMIIFIYSSDMVNNTPRPIPSVMKHLLEKTKETEANS